MMSDAVARRRVVPAVALSTSSVWPESTAVAFEIASRLGYDGIELMVSGDPVSQDIDTIRRLSEYHEIPVLSVHSPCLLISQRVWGIDPWPKLVRSQIAAERLGARVVVTHPPFRWQRSYARGFVDGIARMHDETDVVFAVENMFPQRSPLGLDLDTYAPSWNPVDAPYAHVTLDVSHAAVARLNALTMLEKLGARVAHVHLADGTGSRNDEHLVPGRGNQPCREVLERLAFLEFAGTVVLEVNTRRAVSHDQRIADLAESLAFSRAALSVVSR
jgi:sugar phosphate isomerase/epimerase